VLSTSAAFDTAIVKNARAMRGRVVVNFTDLFFDATATGTSSDENRVSQTEQISNGKRAMTYKWASCDGSSVVDGTYHPCPTDDVEQFNEIGWWSQSMCDASGDFATDAIATATFAARKVGSIFISGDCKRAEYPVDFTVKLYAGAVLEKTITVTSNTLCDYEETFTDESAITSLVLAISKWSTGSRVAKIAEAATAIIRTFDDVDISSFVGTEQREISNDNSIPTGNIAAADLSLSLMNADRKFDANNTTSDLYGLLKFNNKVNAEIGILTTSGVEYVPVFSGWSKGWDVPDKSIIASTQCLDILDFLNQTHITTQTVVADDTFYDWFVTVLNDAGLDSSFYNIDTDLNGTDYVVPYGWFSAVSHREALKILATACSASVYQDRTGIIQIESVEWFDSHDTVSQQTFDRSDYMDKSNQPIYANIANRINVTTSPLKVTTGVTIYETITDEPEEIAASTTDTYTIYYTDEPVSNQVASISPPVSGVTITASSHYAWGSNITVQNTNGTAQTFLFSVTGYTYEVSGKKTVTRSDTTSINNNGENEFNFPDNAFLQKKVLAEKIADTLLASYKDPERDLTMNFNPGGNPALELSDKMTCTDRYQSKLYNIVSSTISYNGGMSQQIAGRVT